MKYPIFVLLSLASFNASSQMPPGMDQAQMQQMMQQMQRMQNCMQSIDQTAMKAIEQRARKMEAELKRLCALGQRDEAQSTAIAFGREVADDPSMQQMKKCGEQMSHLLPNLPIPQSETSESDQSSRHVCDSFN